MTWSTAYPGSGSLLAVFTSYINATSTTVRGIDLDARQSFDLGTAGKLALDLQWSHINKYEFVDTDGTKYDFAGTHDNCNVTNCIGTPKDRINFGATWDIDRLERERRGELSRQVRQHGAVFDRLRVAPRRSPTATDAPERLRDPVVLHDRPVRQLEGDRCVRGLRLGAERHRPDRATGSDHLWRRSTTTRWTSAVRSGVSTRWA